MGMLSIDIEMNEIDNIAKKIDDFNYNVSDLIGQYDTKIDETVNNPDTAGTEFASYEIKKMSYMRNSSSPPNVLKKQLHNYSLWLNYVTKVYRQAQARCYDYAFRITTYDFVQDTTLFSEIGENWWVKNTYN